MEDKMMLVSLAPGSKRESFVRHHACWMQIRACGYHGRASSEWALPSLLHFVCFWIVESCEKFERLVGVPTVI